MIAFKNLLRRKARTLFAVLQIAVAIAAFVAIWGVTQGLKNQFYRLGQVFAYDMVVQTKGSPSPLFSAVTKADADKIAQVPGIKAVSRLGINFMRAPQLDQPVGLLAMEPGSEVLSRYQILRGRTLKDGDTNQILVGELMAETLGIDPQKQVLTAGGVQGAPPRVVFNDGTHTFEVVGIFRSPLDDVGFLKGQALMVLSFFEKQTQRPAHLAFAHTKPGHRAKDRAEIDAALAQCKQIGPGVNKVVPRLQAKTIGGLLDSFKQAELVDAFAAAIALLAALVSGIGVANTMLMSVFDRTKEIGLLRAIGWSRWRIIGMIQSEGLVLAVIGGLAGVPIGLFLIEMSKLLIKLGWLEISLDPVTYVLALAVAAGIGLIGAMYPAWRAAQMQPTEALRYE